MAEEAVLLLRTFYEQGNPNGKVLFTIFLADILNNTATKLGYKVNNNDLP